ncbi:MAG: hypothetical protein QM523_02525 [Candidatus Pacebacteria bacterium]|nr:hypothetical protein [Candidatus Paceibacterota bacterium]
MVDVRCYKSKDMQEWGVEMSNDDLSDSQIQQLMMMQQNLAREIGIDSLDIETQQQIISEMGELIMREYMIDCYDACPSHLQNQFKNLIENSDDPDEISSFVQRHIANADVILQKSSAKIVNSYKQNMNP